MNVGNDKETLLNRNAFETLTSYYGNMTTIPRTPARDEMALEPLSTAKGTMQPESMSLWLHLEGKR